MIKWGAETDFRATIGNGFIMGVSDVSLDEYIICAPRLLYRIRGSKVLSQAPYHFSACKYVRALNMAFGISIGVAKMTGFYLESFNSPIFTEFPLGQAFVHQIEYIEHLNLMITIGSDIKVWKYTVPKVIRSDVKWKPLTLVATMPSSAFCGTIHNAYVDEDLERIFVPSSSGYTLYDFQGKILAHLPELASLTFYCVAMLPLTKRLPVLKSGPNVIQNAFKRFLGADSSGSLKMWHSSGRVMSMFSVSGTMMFSSFVTSEFVVLVDMQGIISIMDVKTGRWFVVAKTDREPDKVFYFPRHRKLVILMANNIHVFDLHLVWKLWYRPVANPLFIQKYTSPKYSSRFGILSSDGNFSLFSQKSKNVIASAANVSLVTPISACYDRSCNDGIMFFTMSDGRLHFYELEGEDFAFKCEAKTRATVAILAQKMKPLQWVVCYGNQSGAITVTDAMNSIQYGRFSIDTHPVRFIFWYQRMSVIICITHKKLAVISLYTMSVLYIVQIKHPVNAVFEEGTLLTTDSHNILYRYEISEREDGFRLISESCFDADIVSLSLRYGVHMIIAAGGNIIIGTKAKVTCVTIVVPVELLQGCIINMDMDLVVATDREMMFISGKLLGGEVEPMMCEIDDNDEGKRDYLFVAREVSKRGKRMPISVVKEIVEESKESEIEIVFRIRKLLEEQEREKNAPVERLHLEKEITKEVKRKRELREKIRQEMLKLAERNRQFSEEAKKMFRGFSAGGSQLLSHDLEKERFLKEMKGDMKEEEPRPEPSSTLEPAPLEIPDMTIEHNGDDDLAAGDGPGTDQPSQNEENNTTEKPSKSPRGARTRRSGKRKQTLNQETVDKIKKMAEDIKEKVPEFSKPIPENHKFTLASDQELQISINEQQKLENPRRSSDILLDDSKGLNQSTGRLRKRSNSIRKMDIRKSPSSTDRSALVLDEARDRSPLLTSDNCDDSEQSGLVPFPTMQGRPRATSIKPRKSRAAIARQPSRGSIAPQGSFPKLGGITPQPSRSSIITPQGSSANLFLARDIGDLSSTDDHHPAPPVASSPAAHPRMRRRSVSLRSIQRPAISEEDSPVAMALIGEEPTPQTQVEAPPPLAFADQFSSLSLLDQELLKSQETTDPVQQNPAEQEPQPPVNPPPKKKHKSKPKAEPKPKKVVHDVQGFVNRYDAELNAIGKEKKAQTPTFSKSAPVRARSPKEKPPVVTSPPDAPPDPEFPDLSHLPDTHQFANSVKLEHMKRQILVTSNDLLLLEDPDERYITLRPLSSRRSSNSGFSRTQVLKFWDKQEKTKNVLSELPQLQRIPRLIGNRM